MSEEKLFSVKEVAARYGLKVSWVYRCKDLKKIGFKVGKYVRWRESDLVALEEYRQIKRGGGFPLKWCRTQVETEQTLMRLNDKTNDEARRRTRILFDIK